MTTQQLEALLIDQALGELSEEASVLLETYLAHFPERRAEAEQARRAVGLTERAVADRPLALEPDGEATMLAFPPGRARLSGGGPPRTRARGRVFPGEGERRVPFPPRGRRWFRWILRPLAVGALPRRGQRAPRRDPPLRSEFLTNIP
jgi:hypothetical protein